MPIRGRLVADEHARRVVAPPYDALTPEQRREHVARQPDSYLAVLPVAGDRYDDHEANLTALDRLLSTGRFRPLSEPALLIQELHTEHGRIRAVLGDLPAAAFRDGRVRPHESVRADRVDALAEHLRTVGVASSPVSVVHPPDPQVEQLTVARLSTPPDLDTTLDDGTHLRVWTVTDRQARTALSRALAAAGPLTVADGHHRAAAVGAALGDDGPVLTAVSPAHHLDVLAFHRRIEGLGDVEVAAVRDVLPGPMRPLERPDTTPARGTVHLAVGGRWFALRLPEPADGGHASGRGVHDPVARLDASRAQAAVVERLLTLADDPAAVSVVPVPATSGAEPLSQPGTVGLALHPPSIDELLTVASVGAQMPFKSTYLVPKLRSGVVVIPRTDAARSRLQTAIGGEAEHVPEPGDGRHGRTHDTDHDHR